MSEILKTNPTALHASVFYEFLREKNVEKAYKNFCKTVGEDAIDYVDFEYWFNRFYQGNLDLDHDRSTDLKPLTHPALQMEMLNEIVGNLDIRERLNVRKVSRNFEKVVDSFKQEIDDVSIIIGEQEVQFRLDNYSVFYKKGKNDAFVQRKIDKRNNLNIELSDLSAVLSNSKSQIKCFRICTLLPEIIDFMPKVIDALSKYGCPVFYAKRVVLDFENDDNVIPILSLIKPGVLEELHFHRFELSDETFANLVEMDQFKQLKRFHIWTPISLQKLMKLSHLYNIQIYMDHVSAEEIVIIRDVLSQFANIRCSKISLVHPMSLCEIAKALGIDYDNIRRINYHHPIPNDDKLLILKIDSGSIDVTFSLSPQKVSEVLKTNPTALRTCIFFEFRRTKNVEKAYKNFCKTVGEDVIEYVDFEYWFYGFYHGNVDFDHDRSAAPKQLSLTDLPNEMLNEIFGNLDILDRINVRKVSRMFEKVVDMVKGEFVDVSINIHGNQEMNIYLYNDSAIDEINRFNIEPRALSTMLTNSKTPIDYFFILIERLDENNDIMPKFIESLSKDVSPQFYAKRAELFIEDDDYLNPMLSLFKPGVLEEFSLDLAQLDEDMFAKLFETDQFKQLKHFSYWQLFPLSQIKQLSHLSMFEIKMDYVSAEDVVIIRDVLLQFVNLKEGYIKISDMDLSEIRAVLRNDDDDSEEISFLYPMPSSDKSLRLDIDSDRIYAFCVNN